MGSFLGWIMESSLLVLMIFGIRRVFMGRVRYAGIYALWLVILIRFLVPVNVMSTPLSVGSLVSRTISAWKPAQSNLAQSNSSVLNTESQKLKGMKKQEKADTYEKESGKQEAVAALGNAALRQKAVITQENAMRNFLEGLDWQRIFKTSWMVISGCLFFWLSLSNICLMWKLKKDRSFYASKNGINIYGVSGLGTPCLYGFFHPVIYVPRELLEGEADDGELDQIITHEYVHYRHKDHIWSLFRMLLVSVYWFHPFMWLAVSYSKKDAELFCDETVIRTLGEENRFSYGEMLVRLAGESRWGDFRYSLMPMSRKGREMERRIRAVSTRKRYTGWLILPLLFMVSIAVGVTCSAGVNPIKEGSKMVLQKEEREKEETVFNGGEGEKEGKNIIGGMGQPSHNSGDIPREYQEWLRGNGNQWKEEPSVSSEGAETAPEQAETAGGANQNEGKAAITVKVGVDEEVDTVDIVSSNYREAFRHYIEVFTSAVNTGNIDKMRLVLEEGSEVYAQQCALVKNYYKRGIKEEIKGYMISAVVVESALQVEILSNEKIKVFYKDGTSKLVKQRYRYRCENVNGSWLIKGMEEVE